ncbi:nucleotidyltransferase domain-containing protein, partial [Brevibacillus parabrevis]|uniref:nucleotidyltransferase domain-containing protein n=2 Tax=Brevibacillus parabrevis TaxID=54914 RepID=UPI003D22E985
WDKEAMVSHFRKTENGNGRQNVGTSKGHVNEAPRKDIPHETTPPKGGKASGDSGHSQHDEPVTDKKGNDANKNQSHEKEKAGAEGMGEGLKIPQGLTQAQFDKASSMIREKVGHISDDIVVQGSRAKGTAKPTSDIDIAIRVPAEKFDELIQSSFSKVKPPNPGSAKEKTMLHAIETGKIQSGEAKLSKFREQLQQELGMDVDISIIKIGGPFDNPPFTPLK